MDPSYHSRAQAITIVSRDDHAAVASAMLAQAIRDGVGAEGSASLALSGGRSPQPVHAALAGEPDVPWAQVRIFFADERGVPPDDPESNYGMARASLLARVPVPAHAIFRMPAERADREAAARDYAASLPEALDLLVLGLGADGHTCSLFPQSPAVRETVRTVVPSDGPTPPRERLTITPPVIARARRVVMLVTGAAKAAAVRAALEGPDDPVECPGVLARHGIWILDAEAGSQLTRRLTG